MKTSSHNLENIKASVNERGFHYIDEFLLENEFQRCSELALKAWETKNDWFLRIDNGEKSYNIHYDSDIITNDFYNKFRLYIDIDSDRLTY